MTTSQTYDGDIRELSGPGRAVALAALVADLRSPDPEVRDERGYVTAVRWIPSLDATERHLLGDRMAAHFDHPAVQARAFAPLVLARIVEAGDWRREWWRAFADWYPAETDLRGHDPVLGWVHAAAHGADLLAALARRPGQDPLSLAGSAVARLLAPTDHVFDAQEDDRLAYALAQILSHPGLTEARSTQWLEPVARAFRTGEPGPVPAWASNTMRTLRMLYLLADRGLNTRNTDEPPHALTHREAVLKALAETLAIVAPYTG
ncbi:DUF2785 domain-containing protein [Streptomyces brasiliensis]|uniref:DUF2785 domain-containing protein n=1 Tax=Streptomyces brasiliensis TaxID=1954 RepID=A0A917K969_9ACTN|nr:DUF2785 domain-containing protein [Streptomyces brasiliensis]GGJ05487.1 hypothetical protein GCM10010121_014900 [Streptomyces brasiliensis]